MEKSLKLLSEATMEAIYNYAVPDEADITPTIVANTLIDIRLSLMKDDFKEKGFIPSGYHQRMCCLEIKCEKKGCPIDNPLVPSPYKEWYVELPSLEHDTPGAIEFFGTVGMDVSFAKTSLKGFLFSKGRIFTASKPYYTIVNDATKGPIALVKNFPTSGAKYVCMIGAINNPASGCDFNEDETFPIPGTRLMKLQYLAFRHFVMSLGLPKDVLNDYADRLGLELKPKQA